MRNKAREPVPGDKVVLVALPQGLLNGLPEEDQQAILEIVGKPIQLNEYDGDGRAELEFIDKDGIIHFIYVKRDAIRIA